MAIAGLVIGIVGIVGAASLVIIGALGTTNSPDSTTFPPTTTLTLGQSARIPISSQDNGIARVTVYAVSYPVTSQDPKASPEPGKEFAVADVEACAGPAGSPIGLNPLDFMLRFPDGTSVTAPNGFAAIRTPAIENVYSLGAQQCTRGFLPFEIATGSHPSGIEYGIPGVFRWRI